MRWTVLAVLVGCSVPGNRLVIMGDPSDVLLEEERNETVVITQCDDRTWYVETRQGERVSPDVLRDLLDVVWDFPSIQGVGVDGLSDCFTAGRVVTVRLSDWSSLDEVVRLVVDTFVDANVRTSVEVEVRPSILRGGAPNE